MLGERVRVGAVPRLDAYFANLLGCGVELFARPGLHVIPSERRAHPGWAGFMSPIYAIATPEGGVVSVRPEQVELFRRELADVSTSGAIGPPVLGRLHRLSQRLVPYAYALEGDILYCDRWTYRGDPGLAEWLPPTDPRGTSLRRRFDGEVFVIWGGRGEIASWAAIKLKSSEVWEIAVTTEPPYRGRGYARQVVSAATRYIIDQGRLALYVHDFANRPSARVARAVGFQEYTETFFCEY